MGLLTNDVAWAARAWTALSGQSVTASRAPVRIGVLAAQLHSPALEPGVADALAHALERLRADETLIGEIVEVDDAPLQAIDATFDAILGWEAWQQLGPLAEREPERLGPETLRLLRGVADVTRERYEDALRTREELSGSCARVYESADVLLSPAAPFVAPATTPPVDTDEGELEALFTRVHNVTGAPALVLPCGWADGLPVGLQLSAAPGRDATLLAAAACVETVLAFARPATAGVELPAPAAGWTIPDPAGGAVEVAR